MKTKSIYIVERETSGYLPVIFILRYQADQANLFCIQNVQHILHEPFFVGEVVHSTGLLYFVNLAFTPVRAALATFDLRPFDFYNPSEFHKLYVADSHKFIKVKKS